RTGSDRIFARLVTSFETQLWRVNPFYRSTFGVSSGNEDLTEQEAGALVSLRPFNTAQIGLSYLWLPYHEAESTPPARGRQSPDSSAPLESWDHPIPRVLVKNDSVEFWMAHFRFRPRPGLFLQLTAGRSIDGRLRGTALVEDAEGHLVRDPVRAYDFSLRGG